MKLYRVSSYDYGRSGPEGPTIVSSGLHTRAFSSLSVAEREYARQRREFRKRNVRYTIRLDLLEVPAMTRELWISAIEEGELPYTVVEWIRMASEGEPSKEGGKL